MSEQLRSFEQYIDGEWMASEGGGTMESVDPFTGKPWAVLPDSSAADVDAAVGAAREAFDRGPWPHLLPRERAGYIHRLAELIERDGEQLAEVETRDSGKLLKEMRGQVAGLPTTYRYFAEWADKIHGETIPTGKEGFIAWTIPEPVGVILAITVWNSPLFSLTVKAAPALAAGCCVVVKPSEHTTASTLEFARLVEEAGFPKGVFNVVCGGPSVGAALTAHSGIDRVAFTGSTATGRRVAAAAAAHLAPSTLELGGKSANVIFEDADIEAAVNGVTAGIFAATGQTCVAGSRILVHESVYAEVVERVAERAGRICLGNPMSPDTEMGPVAYRQHHERILEYIELGRSAGATVVAGGGPPQDGELADGLFVAPTLLADVEPEARIAQEEIFGPVGCVFPFADEEEAIALANSTSFGLAAGIWTREVHRAHRLVPRLRAGTIWINAYRVLGYAVPYGGFKESGYGLESGREGLGEFLTSKSVWLETSGTTRDPFLLG
jgi:acyl-CoA reductase-like NAD-dependent aldehyde dehydrogenase